MATKKPRLSVVLDPEVYRIISDMAELSGVSRSRLVGDMLRDSAPAFSVACQIMKRAKEAPKEVRRAIAEDYESAAADLAVRAGRFLGDLGAEFGVPDPRTCNTGVTEIPTGGKTR